ncbi:MULTISPECIES: MBL fold metallo-hydrolase [Cyanophyceae]|uniref:MBL fold metallo-hydrolase n=1 Tax=Leptolyngbya subtilissima DQ-A4 TaxID=2933933 RepID=A0ABV0K148_9CYAN|nr:MBL fold metallo-hydrolase [Nodosilinea sp. FACHB-141]MBD2111198.1 MBL fold metallo-hydrolase [Nodosilinea sp. FACHB-141]
MKQLQQWVLGLLLVTLTAVGLITLQPRATAQDTPTPATLESAGLTLEELSDGVYGLIASVDFPPADPGMAICNGGIVIGSDGVLVVDPFQTEALGDLLFETVATLTDLPVRYVVNTHYHFDHTGGNPAAASRQLPILGRGPIREFMLTRNGENDPNPTPPDVSISGTWDLWLSDGQEPAESQRSVQIREFEGHSGGTDVVVYVPDANVLIAGDLLFNESVPYVSDGNIRAWQATLEQLTIDYPTATLLPGHGAVTDIEGLVAFKSYLDNLVTLAEGWKAAGISKEDALATPLPTQYSSFRFQALFSGNLEAAYNQITLGQDDAASIQQYLATQPEAVKAL